MASRIGLYNEQPWNVLHVSCNHEKRIARNLALRGVEHYLPQYEVTSHWSDRNVLLHKALFPGYLFIRFPWEQRISILSIPGVLRILGNQKESVVNVDEIARIRLALKQGYVLRPYMGFCVGNQVRIRHGVFKDLIGCIIKVNGQHSVVLKLSGTEQRFSVNVRISALEPVINFEPLCTVI